MRLKKAVTGVWCDGDTCECAAALDFGDGRWVADGKVEVSHT